MKSILMIGVAVIALQISAVNAQSANREFADIYTDCGLGAMIAPRNDAVAAVTNVTWDLGTTAISSNATSPDTCAGGKGSSAAFIFDTYPQLEKDLAIGSGKHLDTLLAIIGVDEASSEMIRMELRSGFAEIVAEENYSNKSRYSKSESLYNLLHSEAG